MYFWILKKATNGQLNSKQSTLYKSSGVSHLLLLPFLILHQQLVPLLLHKLSVCTPFKWCTCIFWHLQANAAHKSSRIPLPFASILKEQTETKSICALISYCSSTQSAIVVRLKPEAYYTCPSQLIRSIAYTPCKTCTQLNYAPHSKVMEAIATSTHTYPINQSESTTINR